MAARGTASGTTSSASHRLSISHRPDEPAHCTPPGIAQYQSGSVTMPEDLGDQPDRDRAEREPDDAVHDQPLQVLPGLAVAQRRGQPREELLAAVIVVAAGQRPAEDERGVAAVEVGGPTERDRAGRA